MDSELFQTRFDLCICARDQDLAFVVLSFLHHPFDRQCGGNTKMWNVCYIE